MTSTARYAYSIFFCVWLMDTQLCTKNYLLSNFELPCWISISGPLSYRQTCDMYCVPAYLECVHFSVVKKHEDGHLEGRDLQDVLAGVHTSHLSTSHTHVWTFLLQLMRGTITQQRTTFNAASPLFWKELVTREYSHKQCNIKLVFVPTVLTVP